jgi:hypothetical protein
MSAPSLDGGCIRGEARCRVAGRAGPILATTPAS